jgi:glycerol-3-phosphate acyltransferase PlsX
MTDDPVWAVRSQPDVSVRVCADLVKAGTADATVSAGHSGAAVAAATFVLGRMRGAVRPALAVVLPALEGPVVLLDAGASMTASPDLLAGSALAGAAYAQALGIDDPRVGLLTVGAEPGKGDQVRIDAHGLLAALPLRYVGPVEGYQVALGGVADVVVTDGFTGNVVLKSVEGALAWAVESVGRRYDDPAPAREVLREAAHGPYAGGMLLGVSGVSVVAHGAADALGVAACVALAARAVRGGVVPRTGAALADLVRLRRDAAGLA